MTTFDGIIEAYLLRTEGLDPHHSLDDSRAARAVLDEFTRRWPEHAEELREFVDTQWLMETGPEGEADPELEERIVQRGLAVARRLLEERSKKKS